VEIAPEWRPKPFWRLRASYSLLNMYLHQLKPAEIAQLPSAISGASPWNEITAGSSLDIGSRLQVDLTFRYVSALPALSVPSYSTGDARVAWRFLKQFELSAVGQNLFQPYHVESVYDPGPPVAIRRTVYGSLAWRSK
jgi:iron complex outermembrane recepter protein